MGNICFSCVLSGSLRGLPQGQQGAGHAAWLHVLLPREAGQALLAEVHCGHECVGKDQAWGLSVSDLAHPCGTLGRETLTGAALSGCFPLMAKLQPPTPVCRVRAGVLSHCSRCRVRMGAMGEG